MIRRLFPNVPDRSGSALRAHLIFALVASVLGLASPLAVAALPRPIPDEAVKAKMAFATAGAVHVKGEALRLSPGAQIRDTSNLGLPLWILRGQVLGGPVVAVGQPGIVRVVFDIRVAELG